MKLTIIIRFKWLFVINFLSKRLFINPCCQHSVLKYRKVGGWNRSWWSFNWQIFASVRSHFFDQYHVLLQFCNWLLATHVRRFPHINWFDPVGLSHSEFLLHYHLLVKIIFHLNSCNLIIVSRIIKIFDHIVRSHWIMLVSRRVP